MKVVLEIELFDAGPFSTKAYDINYPSIIKFKYGWSLTEKGCRCTVWNVPMPFFNYRCIVPWRDHYNDYHALNHRLIDLRETED